VAHRLLTAFTFVQLTGACEPQLVVGTWSCGGTTGTANPATDGGVSNATSAVPIPWSGGFEDGFCSYPGPAAPGFCYTAAGPGGSFEMVRSPVHSGAFAAAFSVDSSIDTGTQARCVRQGVLPSAAYYGAWYFVPSVQTNNGNWNLLHFQGGTGPGEQLHNLWDVSLVNDQSGNLKLSVLNLLGKTGVGTNAAPPIPIGSWFHIQMYLRRASDATGEVTVYQDGVVAYHLVDLLTDDTPWGQWYVGNLATAIVPPQSTIYVDDVEISDTF